MQKRIVFFLFKCLAYALLFQSSVAQAAYTAQDVKAFNYVINICASYQTINFDELKMFASILTTTFVDTLDMEEFSKRIQAGNSAPQELTDLVNTDGFIIGIHTCHPHSEHRRNLLALKIILMNSTANALGVGVNLYGAAKVFGFAAARLGSGAGWTLSKIGVSERAIQILGKMGVYTGRTAAGLGTAAIVANMAAPYIEWLIRYFEMKKMARENLTELQELAALEATFLANIENSQSREELAHNKDQLRRVREIIDYRKGLTTKTGENL